MTLPLIYTLNNSSKEEKKWIINTVKNYNEDKVRVNELIKFIQSKGGIEYAEKMMYDYKQRAFDIIETIHDTDSKDGLLNLINYITERNY